MGILAAGVLIKRKFVGCQPNGLQMHGSTKGCSRIASSGKMKTDQPSIVWQMTHMRPDVACKGSMLNDE
jgi:hypothetical protein